ncbi:MAG: tripartite tricarboxylate transporter substrate binding protein [Chloroflexota bacterium]
MPFLCNWRSLVILGSAGLLVATTAGCTLPFVPGPNLSPVATATPTPEVGAPPEVQKPYNFPNKPITLVVGDPKGTEVDAATRGLIARLEKTLGQPVVVVNQVGGDGLEAWTQLKKSRADGYVVGLIASPRFQLMALDPQRVPPFAPGDFTPVANYLADPGAVFVRNGSPFRSLGELVASARAQPESISVSIPVGSPVDRLAAAQFQQRAGVKLRVIEFVDATNARLAGLSGQVEAVFGRYSNLAPLVRSRQGRFLALLEEKRLQEWPELPTARESGVDLISYTSLGYAVPRGTSQEVVDYLAWALYGAASAPESRAAMRDADLSVRFMGPAQYAAHLSGQEQMVRESFSARNLPR